MSAANPYASPRETDTPPEQMTWADSWLVLLFGPLAGVVIGCLTNAVNGGVSPGYFTAVMGWETNIWLRSMGQGMLEGAAYGFGNAVIFLVAVLTILRGAGFTRTIRAVLLAAITVLILWVLGGIAAEVMLACNPRYLVQFGWAPGYGSEWGYAWVFGSIQGAVTGSPLATIGALVWLRQQLVADPPDGSAPTAPDPARP